MKNLFKRISALVMTAIMVLTMCATVFAADGTPTVPTEGDTATATVNNVEAGATVTAYQITKATYDNGFTGYEPVNGVTLANVLAPTSDEVTGIAKNVGSLTSVTMNPTGTEGLVSYTAQLNAGYWIVLVTGGKEVYNPMLLGVYYSKNGSDNTMTSNPVNANSDWALVTANAYAKSTAPSIKKEIVKSTFGEDAKDNTDSHITAENPGKGNDVAVGDTVDFKITTNIPSYSAQYESVVVKIEDTLSKGLTLKSDTVKINGAAVDDNMGTLETTEQGLTFTFKSAYALAHQNEEVVVTYSATVNDQAEKNFDPNTNTAKLVYSNNPSDENDVKETEDKTYTYTFSIGAALSASIQNYNKKINQIIKVDADGNVISTNIEEGKLEADKAIQVKSGATFTLTNKATKKVYTATTGADGGLTFDGLDAGEYTLVETVAPDGFTLDKTPHTVKIDATYTPEGKLNTLSIKIDNAESSVYTASYTKDGTINKIEEKTVVTSIANTKISTLPSTGGMGTYLFTIVGVVLMACAAGAFFISRRKTEE